VFVRFSLYLTLKLNARLKEREVSLDIRNTPWEPSPLILLIALGREIAVARPAVDIAWIWKEISLQCRRRTTLPNRSCYLFHDSLTLDFFYQPFPYNLSPFSFPSTPHATLVNWYLIECLLQPWSERDDNKTANLWSKWVAASSRTARSFRWVKCICSKENVKWY
jgi:hypothetical protein